VLSAIGSFGNGAALSMTMAAALFGALVLAAWGVIVWPRAMVRRRAPTWTCGMTPQSRSTIPPRRSPSRCVLSCLVVSTETECRRQTGSTPYVLRQLRWRSQVVDLAQVFVYTRLQIGVTRLARAIRRRSTGRIHDYIGIVLITLLITLLVFGRADVDYPMTQWILALARWLCWWRSDRW